MMDYNNEFYHVKNKGESRNAIRVNFKLEWCEIQRDSIRNKPIVKTLYWLFRIRVRMAKILSNLAIPPGGPASNFS